MSTMPFGDYYGQDIESVPSDYLEWTVLQDWFEDKYGDLLKEVEEELAHRTDYNRHFYSERR